MDGLYVRPVDTGDFEQLWRWRNDPQTRRMERTPDFIPRAQYDGWLQHGLTCPQRRLYMAMFEDVAMGLCELALGFGGVAGIGINLDPAYRGRGLATPVIDATLAASSCELGYGRVVAEIRAENIPSRRAFARAGFRVLSEDQSTAILRLSREIVSAAFGSEVLWPLRGPLRASDR